jgi:predicted PurR-regulated permease PerM
MPRAHRLNQFATTAQSLGCRRRQEVTVDFLRARREKRYAPVITDPQPLTSTGDPWFLAAQTATVGIFLLLLITCLYFARPIVLPVTAAVVVAMTFAPIIKRGQAVGLSPWVSAVIIAVLMAATAGIVVTLIAAPVGEWINRGPEIAESIKQKLYVLDRPLVAMRELQKSLMPSSGNEVAVETSHISMVAPVLAVLTPALTEIVVFFATLIFLLAEQMSFRRYVASFFTGRDAKLRFIRTINDTEQNLASYVAVMTCINAALGVVVAMGAWLFGFPNPWIFGGIAMVLNYLPYIGPACVAITLFVVGLVTFPTLGYALLPPASFVALTTIEGQIITPTILGHRLTLNPLAVFLAIAFWAWLWGPMGAFLGVPLLIVGMVIVSHVFPSEESKLPG